MGQKYLLNNFNNNKLLHVRCSGNYNLKITWNTHTWKRRLTKMKSTQDKKQTSQLQSKLRTLKHSRVITKRRHISSFCTNIWHLIGKFFYFFYFSDNRKGAKLRSETSQSTHDLTARHLLAHCSSSRGVLVLWIEFEFLDDRASRTVEQRNSYDHVGVTNNLYGQTRTFIGVWEMKLLLY